jgi:hypothetical protein
MPGMTFARSIRQWLRPKSASHHDASSSNGTSVTDLQHYVNTNTIDILYHMLCGHSILYIRTCIYSTRWVNEIWSAYYIYVCTVLLLLYFSDCRFLISFSVSKHGVLRRDWANSTRKEHIHTTTSDPSVRHDKGCQDQSNMNSQRVAIFWVKRRPVFSSRHQKTRIRSFVNGIKHRDDWRTVPYVSLILYLMSW